MLLGSSVSVSDGVWDEGAAGGEGDEEVGGTIAEDGGSSPVGLPTSGVLRAWVVDGSSGVKLGAEDGGMATVDVRSSGVELGTGGGLEETTSGVVPTGVLSEIGAEDTTGTSSGVDTGDEDAGADGA